MSALFPTQNARAIALSISAIFLFGLMDVTAKAIAQEANTATALWARYTGQMICVSVLVARQFRSVARSKYLNLQITRSLLLLMATLFFFSSFNYIRLADATAVMSLNPVLITLGGALFLKEALGPRRVIAIAVAFIGALIIIRPGTDVFHPAALLPLGGAFSFATYALITRRLGPDENVWTSLFYTGLVGAVATTLAMPFFWPEQFTAKIIVLMVLIAGIGTLGQLLLIRALSLAEAGLLAPFNYTGLIFAVLWGLVFFSEMPDRLTLLGMLVIAASGLYVWHREMRQRAATQT